MNSDSSNILGIACIAVVVCVIIISIASCVKTCNLQNNETYRANIELQKMKINQEQPDKGFKHSK